MTKDSDEITKLKIKISELNCSLKDYLEAFNLQIGDMNSLILNLVKFNNNKKKYIFVIEIIIIILMIYTLMMIMI